MWNSISHVKQIHINKKDFRRDQEREGHQYRHDNIEGHSNSIFKFV